METVSFKLEDATVNDVCHHVVGFVIGDGGGLKSGGSGTLVRIGKMRGILTAGHVAQQLPDKVGILNFLNPRIQSHEVNIANSCVVWDGVKEHAPDIAFLKLHLVDAGAIEAQQGVFYNLDKPREFKVEKPGNKLGLSHAISGVVDEWKEVKQQGGSTKKYMNFGGIFGASTDVKDFKEGNADLTSLRIDYDKSLRVPQSYGGVSGSGLWELCTELESGKPISVRKRLCGVAFREHDKGTDVHTIVSNSKSAIASLVHEVKEKWPAEV